MKYLILSKGQKAIIDNKDYQNYSKWKWTLHSGNYAVRRENKKMVFLHRELIKAQKGQIVDHINLNGLDCRKQNLRLVNRRWNSTNRLKQKGFYSSRYKGVYYSKHTKCWVAQIKYKKQLWTGTFPKEHWAALAYDLWATKLFGKFARTNFFVVAHK